MKLGNFMLGVFGRSAPDILIEPDIPFTFAAFGAFAFSFEVMDFTIVFIGFTSDAMCALMLGSLSLAITYYFLAFLAILRFNPRIPEIAFLATLLTGFLKPTPGKLLRPSPSFDLIDASASLSGGIGGADIGDPKFIASPVIGPGAEGGIGGIAGIFGIIGNGIGVKLDRLLRFALQLLNDTAHHILLHSSAGF
jgi:hypothetical protein